jgi:hypothetical protein
MNPSSLSPVSGPSAGLEALDRPLVTWGPLGPPGALASPLGAHLTSISSPSSPTYHLECSAGETCTYQDKEQKSWGQEAKSHVYSGVGPSGSPL